MNATELLADWLNDISRGIHRAIEKMPPEQLAWQPDAEANSIGVTVWHIARWLDILAVQAINGKRAEEEQWFTRGWAKKTTYDPRGIGLNGLGAVTGYSLDDVKAIPHLSAEELLVYLDQVSELLHSRLLKLTDDDFARPLPSLGGTRVRTLYEWMKGIMQGGLAHLGEIVALKLIYDRAHKKEST